MSSTDPSRGSDSSMPNGDDENLFIKFKRFADAQIGAVLQGVIGLPSALSKHPNDAINSRWADLQDDLKRRDEARAEQQSHTTSDSADWEDDYSKEEFVKWSQRWWLPPHTMSEIGGAGRVSSKINVINWNFKHPPRQPDHICGPGWTRNKFDQLFDDQTDGSALEMIQKSVVDAFHPKAGFGECNPLQSSQPVLPYILFSPYSPLALSLGASSSGGDSTSGTDKEGDFPYCEAFQDLLLASQGRPMTTWHRIPHKYKRELKCNRERSQAIFGLCWIDSLFYYGLLTEKFPPSVAFDEYGPSPFGVIFEKKELFGEQSQFPHLRKSFRGPEEEHYALLDNPAKQFKWPMSIADLLHDLDQTNALFGFTDNDNDKGKDERDNTAASPAKLVKEYENQDESAKLLQMLHFANIFGKTSTAAQIETFLKMEVPPCMAGSVNPIEKVQFNPTAEDRVVSSTTTTEQFQGPSQSVCTTVTVKKNYIDGRSLVTSTTKTEIPPQYEPQPFEWMIGRVQEGDEGRCPYCDAKYNDEPDNEQSSKQTPDKNGKGWFWN